MYEGEAAGGASENASDKMGSQAAIHGTHNEGGEEKDQNACNSESNALIIPMQLQAQDEMPCARVSPPPGQCISYPVSCSVHGAQCAYPTKERATLSHSFLMHADLSACLVCFDY